MRRFLRIFELKSCIEGPGLQTRSMPMAIVRSYKVTTKLTTMTRFERGSNDGKPMVARRKVSRASVRQRELEGRRRSR